MHNPHSNHRPEREPVNTVGSQQTVELAYGRRRIPFKYDAEQFALLAPHEVESKALTDDDLHAALDSPIDAPPLEDIVAAHDSVVVVVPDATRVAGVARLAPLLVQRLEARGVNHRRISFLIGGGIHRPPTTSEVHTILGEAVAERIAVHAHDANDASTHARLGQTRQGTPVQLNRRLVEAEHVVLVGGISFHYIAGFSGGRKAALPGCAAEASIQANHLLSFRLDTLEKKAGIASGNLDGNPVHEDMDEAVAMLSPSFLVNTTLDSHNEIAALYAGHWRTAHRRGCEAYAASHTVDASARRPLVIVSIGGAPRDINLIQSHKGMEHASAVLEDGGVMIVLAECAQGLGRDDFLQWFVPGGSRATALRLLENYKINGQTAWGLRRKTENFRVRLVSTLDPETVRFMGMEPHATLESALADTRHTPGYIMPSGLVTLPRLEAVVSV